MHMRRAQGFTLIELIVALAVAAILIGVGVPSFVTLMNETRIGAERDKLVQALYLARSEAAKTASNVTVCPRSTDTSKQCGTDWTRGLIVFADSEIVVGETTAVVSDNDIILRLAEPMHDAVDVTAIGSTTGAAGGAAARHFVRYAARGNTNWRNASFILCDGRGATDARAINIVLTGDIRAARTASDGDTPLDVFGRAVTCAETST